MLKTVKAAGVSVLALVGLVVLAFIALVVWVDPNDYRDDISRVVAATTGVELNLGGNLNWHFYPVLGFGVGDVTLTMQPGQPPLVKVAELVIGVKILPLLSQKIEVDALDVTGMEAVLQVDELGNNNWQPAAKPGRDPGTQQGAATVPATTFESQEAATMPDLVVPQVRVRDSSIQYQDKTAQLAYAVDIPLLQLQDVNFSRPFPLSLEARVRDRTGLDVVLQLVGKLNAQLAHRVYSLEDLQLAATVGGLFVKPVPISLQGDIQFDQSQDTASVELAQIQLANMTARATIDASQISGEPAFHGQIQSEPFDASELMTALDIPPPDTADGRALKQLQFSAKFVGNLQTITINPLKVKLDDSTLSGDVVIVDVASQTTRFALQLDKLDIDRYLPDPSTSAPAVAAVATTAESVEPLIPVELLRTLNLQGTVSAAEITARKIPVRDIAFSVSAIDGKLQLQDLAAKLLQGAVAGNMTVDARQSRPRLMTNIDLTNIELSELLQQFTSLQLVSGRSSLKLNTKTQGNDIDTLIRQALGQLNLSMTETVLHGINVNQVALDAVKTALGDYAVLLPDYQQKLPKALRDDTIIRNLLADMKIEKGHLIMPAFNADTGEGQLTASGDIDLLNQGFDYSFGVVLAALDGNKYLKGSRWPVRCKGNLATPIGEWCRPDTAAMHTMFERAAAQALRDKGAKKLGEKLGVEAADEAAAKAELRQKAREEEDRAKQKLKDSVNKKLNKLFEK